MIAIFRLAKLVLAESLIIAQALEENPPEPDDLFKFPKERVDLMFPGLCESFKTSKGLSSDATKCSLDLIACQSR